MKNKQQKRGFVTLPKAIGMGACIVVALVLLVTFLIGDKNLAVLNPMGWVADEQKQLIIFTVALGMFVVIPVFILLFTFAWRYREGNTKAKYTPDNEGNRWLEVVWWGIPIAIILLLSVVTWVSTHKLDPYKAVDAKDGSMRVQVVALQWKWLFIYPEYGIATVNELRMPVDTAVNFEISADAPMSAFWIPQLGSQIYAMNGMTSKLSLVANELGTYRGTNTNINGEGYAKMDFDAIAMDRNEFEGWAGQVASVDNHLDWSLYETIAKPSEDVPVTYYMLHDNALYDKILAQYMDHGSSHTTDDMSDMHHEGMHH